ncbi:MAG: RES domain-containing protein [Bacteroidetes bacterium]|nr:RES domain-containing protein [Bacteroidota bacterium]
MIMDAFNITRFENQFPTLKEAINFISKLRDLDLSKISLDELGEMIDNGLKTIPFATGTIPKGQTLFRARVNENDISFENISQLGLIPRLKVSDFGRANRPNDAVFYCADNFELSCGEVLQNIKYSSNPKREIGITTVSEWVTMKDLHISPIYYSKNVMEWRKDITEFKKNNSDFIRAKGTIKSKTLDVSDLILEFFCDEFSKSKILTTNDYKFSVWYVMRLKKMNDQIASQHANKKFDGVVYPSVAMKFKGDNIALYDKNLSSKITFKTASEMACADFDFENASFKSFKIRKLDSIGKNGKLNWH